MQPNTNAVERPLTLVEKLEQEKQWWHDEDENNAHRAIDDCIEIIKQHQTWRKISTSDEKPIDMQICNLLVDNESEESPTLYDIALFRKYKDEDVWLCMTRPEEHIDPSKILAWQPMDVPSDDFFNNLQLPSGEGNDKPSD